MPSKQRSAVVVGNARIEADHSQLVDAADVVLRFNECKNYSRFSGTKTTIICACNTGSPAIRFIEEMPFKNLDVCRRAEEFWFPRDVQIQRSFLVRNGIQYPLSEFEDLSSAIVRSNGLSGKTFDVFTSLFNAHVFRKILRFQGQHGLEGEYFVCPSTGFLGVEYLLSAPRFCDCEVHLIGFDFCGWTGHPWETERRIVEEYAASNRVILHGSPGS